MGDLIESEAQKDTGPESRMKYIYFFGRLDQVFEFGGSGTDCFIDPFPVLSIPEDRFQDRLDAERKPGCKVDRETLDSRKNEWKRAYSDPPSISTVAMIANYDRIPAYYWTAGCAPTAAAMVLGYYDNKFDVTGYFDGYGRLIEYYKAEYKFPCNDSAALRQSIPNILDELSYYMNTNCAGGTQLDSVTPGIEYVVNTDDSYNFDIIETRDCDTPGEDCYDWCWDEITEQIDDNYPFVWVITCHDCPPGTIRGHALAAFGYNDGDQTIAVYNTWDEQQHWWCHDHYGNNCDWYANQTRVHAIRPGGGDFPNDLQLLAPVGGEILQACIEDTIRWYQRGEAIA